MISDFIFVSRRVNQFNSVLEHWLMLVLAHLIGPELNRRHDFRRYVEVQTASILGFLVLYLFLGVPNMHSALGAFF